MLRRLTLITTLLLLVPAAASAQTLTVEIEGEILTEAAPSTVNAPAPAPAAEVSLDGVVLVRPLEDEPPTAAPRPVVAAPRVIPAAPVAHVIHSHPEPPPAPEPLFDAPEIEGASRMGLTVESMDLANHALLLTRPEVAALGGTELDRDWQDQAAFSVPALVGFEVGLGMRAHGILRGPEVRFGIFGSGLDGESTPAPGNPNFGISAEHLLGLRVELALGLQADLGPVIPYVVGRAIAGVAFVDVDVDHAELGALGGETIEVGYGQLGIEAGMDVEIEEGLTLGMAYRGAWVGPESHGGVITFGFHGGE